MVALKTADIEDFISRPDPRRPIVLVYGADAGLVSERVQKLVHGAVDDPNDPFALARVNGDELSTAPERLVEEAHTVPLFGGRRAVWVKAGSRNIAPAVEALIAAPPQADCRIVIEAGDLRRDSPLRKACEKAKSVAVLPCYTDADRDIARLIDSHLQSARLSMTPEARSMLLSLLGGDRLASRGELAKLTLYVQDKRLIEAEDVIAIVADASALALDGVVDATFAGLADKADAQFAKARSAGAAASAIVGAALRQAIALHRARLDVDAGSGVERALESFRPALHFRRKAFVETALKAWTTAKLERAIQDLAEAALDTRRQGAPAEAVALRALLRAAQTARGPK